MIHCTCQFTLSQTSILYKCNRFLKNGIFLKTFHGSLTDCFLLKKARNHLYINTFMLTHSDWKKKKIYQFTKPPNKLQTNGSVMLMDPLLVPTHNSMI